MARPSWCVNPSCRWLVGGPMDGADDDPDSGMACGGELPAPLLHRDQLNTHRLCLKGCDDPTIDLACTASDLWYLGSLIMNLWQHARRVDVH